MVPSDQLRNRGGLTLISPQYFEFGRSLVLAIAKETTEEILQETGGEKLHDAYKSILTNKELKEIFLSCNNTPIQITSTGAHPDEPPNSDMDDGSNESDEDEDMSIDGELTRKEKENLYESMVSKVFNAKSGKILKGLHQKLTGRHGKGKGSDGISFRGMLKAATAKSSKNAAAKALEFE